MFVVLPVLTLVLFRTVLDDAAAAAGEELRVRESVSCTQVARERLVHPETVEDGVRELAAFALAAPGCPSAHHAFL